MKFFWFKESIFYFFLRWGVSHGVALLPIMGPRGRREGPANRQVGPRGRSEAAAALPLRPSLRRVAPSRAKWRGRGAGRAASLSGGESSSRLLGGIRQRQWRPGQRPGQRPAGRAAGEQHFAPDKIMRIISHKLIVDANGRAHLTRMFLKPIFHLFFKI